MTDRTKLILAITLGSLGLVIGIVAAITAFNAKSEADSDQDVISTVDQRFAEAQAKQDKLEKKQASDAETLVNSLTGKERSLVRQLNKQSKQIKNLQQKTRNNANSVDTLSSREREQSTVVVREELGLHRNSDNLYHGRTGHQEQHLSFSRVSLGQGQSKDDSAPHKRMQRGWKAGQRPKKQPG